MTINTISTLPTAPARTDAPATFVTRADSFLAALVVMQGELNTSIGQMNTDISTINSVEPAASVALASANFKGNWSDLTGALNIPAAVRHSDANWILLEDLPDVTASEPSAGNTDWSIIESLPSQAGNSGKYLTTDGSVASWADVTADPTLGTLNKTFKINEQATISLSSAVTDGVPVVSVTKEVPQTGVTNDLMELNVENTYFERQNSALDTTLDFVDSNYLDPNSEVNVKIFDATMIANGYDLKFNSNGTKMFVMDASVQSVIEFNLSVAWDVTTATASGSNFNFASQDTQPYSIEFNPTGTKMYMGGFQNDSIYEYNLSPPFDVSTASFVGSYNVSAILTQPYGILFNGDGTKVFLSDTNQILHVFDLGTAYSVTTMSHSEDIILPSSSLAATFNSDGTQFIHSTGSQLYWLTLSAPYDFSSYEKTITSGQTSNMYAIALGDNDTKIYEMNRVTDDICQGSISKFKKLSLGAGSFVSDDVGNTIEANDGIFTLIDTAGNIKTITAPSSYSQVASGEWFKYKVRYNGSALELSGSVPNITQYSSAVSKRLDAQSNPNDFKWSTDGTKAYTIGDSNLIYEYTASPAFDLNSLTYTGVSFDPTGQMAAPRTMQFSQDGTKFYILEYSTKTIFQYSMGGAFNLATAFYDSVSFYFGDQGTAFTFNFSNDGSKLFVWNTGSQEMSEYSLSTEYDISTAEFSDSKNIESGTGYYFHTFNDDGSKLYVINTTTDYIRQYSVQKPFVVSSIVYDEIEAILATVFDTIYYANGNFYFPYSLSVYEYRTTAQPYITSGVQFGISQLPIDTTYWSDINSIAAYSSENVYFCYSKDSRTTWSVIDNTDGERDIVRNNAGTWQYNSDATYGSESWTNASVNTEFDALSESTVVAANKMTAPQLRAVTDANNIVLTNDLNFAFGFESDSVYRLPLTGGVSINYDANVLNEGALIGIDYDFDFPATDKVRITAINAGNYKVRVL